MLYEVITDIGRLEQHRQQPGDQPAQRLGRLDSAHLLAIHTATQLRQVIEAVHDIGEVVEQAGIAGQCAAVGIQRLQIVAQLLLGRPATVDLLLALTIEAQPLGLQENVSYNFV